MIVVHPPEVISEDKKSIIRALIESDEGKDYLWFSMPDDFQDYLTPERGDAFLVGILLLAMKKGEDIQLKVGVSERLYYSLTYYLIDALVQALPYLKPVSIIHNGLHQKSMKSLGAVGTGFSAGVDSFCTIAEHLQVNCPDGFKITHFTFHNVGSNGDFGGSEARQLFHERYQLVKPFATEKEVPTILIDSNISELLQMNYLISHTIRNAAAILTLQKLFSYYYYSSGIQLKDFDLSPTSSSGSYDLLTLTMLSTESLTFYSTGVNYSRLEKTRVIADYPSSYRFLNVCSGGTSKNCSTCEKCLRTMLTLDVLGKLPLYNQVFDFEKYEQLKSRYIAKTLASMHNHKYAMEIYQEMQRSSYPIPSQSYLMVPWYRSKPMIKKVLRKP